MPEPLPDSEIDLLIDTITAAIDLADRGTVERGHAALLTGLTRAESLGGEPWGPELVERYRFAVGEYTRLHGCGSSPIN